MEKQQLTFDQIDIIIDELINKQLEVDQDALMRVYESLGLYYSSVFKHRYEYRTGHVLTIPKELITIHLN